MEKAVLQTYELSAHVRPAYLGLYNEAMGILEDKYKRDGLTPLERVLVTLLRLYRGGNYETTLKVWGVKHRYGVINFLPDRPVRNEAYAAIVLHLDDTTLLGLPSLPEALTEALELVRHDLYKRGIMQTVTPSAATLLVGMVCYTAAVESRRRKHRFGLRLLKVTR